MAVGHSDDVDSAAAIAEVIGACRAGLGGLAPQAGIMFAAFDVFDRSVIDAVREAFPGVSIMGSTSAAEVSSVRGYQEDSITLSLFASDEVDVTVGLGSAVDGDVRAAARAAAAQAQSRTAKPARLCIVMTEGLDGDPGLVVAGVAGALPKDVVVVGGASAKHDFAATAAGFQFVDDTIVQGGVAVLLFSGPVAFSTAIGTGWRTIGTAGRVTDSRIGAITGIDGRPATEFLARYIDATGPAAFGNPLAVVEAGASDSYLRAIQGADPESGAVMLTGEVPVGSTVQLTTADTDAILKGTEDALSRATAAFPAGATPQAAMIFSCAIRQFLLGTRTEQEARMARTEYGTSIPLAGMYCYGEVGPIQAESPSRFLQETFVTLLLGT